MVIIVYYAGSCLLKIIRTHPNMIVIILKRVHLKPVIYNNITQARFFFSRLFIFIITSMYVCVCLDINREIRRKYVFGSHLRKSGGVVRA